MPEPAVASAATVDLRARVRDIRRQRRPGRARPRADRPRAGQEAHPRDRRAAARRKRAQGHGPRPRDADAAHVLLRQPGHRQDHGRAPDGRPPASPRLRPQGPSRRRHARRPGRPVHRPHRAEDQGDPEEGDGRRPLHRRGLLPLPPRERARLRPGGDRDPAPGDGEQPRRPGRDPRRLRRPHGPLLREQPRLPLAHRAPHRLPRLHRRRAVPHRREHARPAELPPRHGRPGRARPTTSPGAARQPHFANARSIRNALDRARLRQANRLFEGRKGRSTPRPCRPFRAEDIRASRVFAMPGNKAAGLGEET